MSTNRRSVSGEDQRKDVLAKIKEYGENGFSEASEIHDLIMQANPSLYPRLWYGMPGYAKTKDSAVLCFFRKDALISFGITEAAIANIQHSDESSTPSAWYVRRLDESSRELITQTVLLYTN